MTATWPIGLPDAPLQQGFQETVPKNTARFETDAGPAKVRRRFTAGVRGLKCSFLFTAAELATFDEFVVDTLEGGALQFAWTDPRTSAAITARIKDQPQYRPAGGTDWIAECEIEVLP
jgi:hypothetical protein